jgi:hypothetical protein
VAFPFSIVSNSTVAYIYAGGHFTGPDAKVHTTAAKIIGMAAKRHAASSRQSPLATTGTSQPCHAPRWRYGVARRPLLTSLQGRDPTADVPAGRGPPKVTPVSWCGPSLFCQSIDVAAVQVSRLVAA